MTDPYKLENGHVVEIGNQYRMDYDNKQQGVPEGSEVTVTDITHSIDGVHIYFNTKFPDETEPMEEYIGDPICIYAFALTNLLEDEDGMSVIESAD